MSIIPLIDFKVNPDLDKLMLRLSEQYIHEFPHLVGITLFGSQATGRWDNESDVDVGLIYDEWIATRKIYYGMRNQLETRGFRLCTHNSPGGPDLNMECDEARQIKDLEFLTQQLAQEINLNRITAKQHEGKLFKSFPFCLPFGKVYGDQQRVIIAQSYVNQLIQRTTDPIVIEHQVIRVLNFMYDK